MRVLAVVVGVVLVLSVLADLVNTLVSTTTSRARWWLSNQVYVRSWRLVRRAGRAIGDEARREALLARFAPASLLMLLAVWVLQQVVGFGLIWWGLGGLDGADGLFDSVYYSGVVFFTLGFGEVVPVEAVPRIGALVEAFSGVLTTALLIGYLPVLYGAYSERERLLMTLDAGTEERIDPTTLLMARAPDGEASETFEFFERWEAWIAGVLETHTSFPMLVLFRSKHPGQNWVTALGLIADAALQCQVIVGARTGRRTGRCAVPSCCSKRSPLTST
ncbi:MAG: potassium channel family protein [Acidimicrobiia bacterium]|nr:potassium channel family protein [Acidimicrobiia bacterium]